MSGAINPKKYNKKSRQKSTVFLKKTLNASKPSEHQPNQGGELSNGLGRNIDCKDKNSFKHLLGFLNGSSIGSIVYRGEARRYTIHLHYLTTMQGHQNRVGKTHSLNLDLT